MASRHVVDTVANFPPGERRIVTANKRSIGVFNVDGDYYAIRNKCPHQGGPLCLGSVRGTMLPSKPQEYRYGREGSVVNCPWHGWEFDIKTGESIFRRQAARVGTYEVSVEYDEGAATASAEIPEDDGSTPGPVETFPVAVEDGVVVLYA